MFLKKISLLILFLLISATSISQTKNNNFLYAGRVEKLQNNTVVLIGTASSVSFNFTGNECSISLQSVDSYEHHNYASIVLDGKFIGKLRIEKGAAQSFPIKVTAKKKVHLLEVYKNTEAQSGNILFAGTTAKLTTISAKKKKKIEFIGDSITCAAASDSVDCDKGEYMDHHNGYYAYGPRISREIGVDYLVSSVSGIGMYRNWNDENKDEAIMPDVYENLYLTKDPSKPKYDFAFQPNIISIALGTNDFSGGDGKKERLSFNQEKYVSNYINFIKMLYKHNPNAQIVITNSPMVGGDRAIVFEDCLNKVKAAFANDKSHKEILIFKFKSMTPKGCLGHPDVADHKVLADEYAPFLKKLLNEK
ncbi:GDSL-like lipase/acylhydrolase family protein [Flavobacterium sp. 90]|uniref:SGNH/GDSL hydrolase family protein n=1 Tax=unclassified Flavobacterium TaxID=196869 RepID=UPI000EB37460|nr:MULTISPECIES: SGNH/GDSL hydrolase family protein [unclassified Flavobacterium]RKR11408.1 GDSL-like lipase/acylhydrolase family protein [Flavobacterium sp. 81]TCK55189.1 GDSL-like lipase/acylhydrolase family protein [Flavobacterium sp. 90]